MTPDFSTLADYQLDAAFEAAFFLNDKATADIYGAEITRRQHSFAGWLGGIFVPYMDQFPKYTTLTGQATGAYTATGNAIAGVGQAIVDAPKKALDALQGVIVPVAIIAAVVAVIVLTKKK